MFFLATRSPSRLFGALATHPPIPERIHAIDPSWDGKFPSLDKEQVEVVKRAALSDLKRPSSPMPNILGSILGGAVLSRSDGAKNRSRLSNHILFLPNYRQSDAVAFGIRRKKLRRRAAGKRESRRARTTRRRRAGLRACSSSDDEKIRATQIAENRKTLLAICFPDKTAALFPDVSKIAAHVHLPIINLALGGLRQVERGAIRRKTFHRRYAMAHRKRRQSWNCLNSSCKIVLRNLDSQFNVAEKSPRPILHDQTARAGLRYFAFPRLANVGSDDATEIEKGV